MSHEIHSAKGTEICTAFGIKDWARHSTFFKKCFRCVGCNKTIVFYILFAPNRWDLSCCFGVKCTAWAKKYVYFFGITCISCIKRCHCSFPGNQFAKKTACLKKTDLRTGLIWGSELHLDGSTEVMALRSCWVGEWVSGKTPKPLGILHFCCGGMNLPKLLEFAPFCFWRWT